MERVYVCDDECAREHMSHFACIDFYFVFHSAAASMEIFITLARVWLIGFTPLQCPMLICFDACIARGTTRFARRKRAKRFMCECVNFGLEVEAITA